MRAAVGLLDTYLSQFDGDWGIWLYFAGLCARIGRRPESVAAYRACARQLEADGLHDRARDALRSAIQLVPTDAELKRELEQIGRPPRRPDPAQETFLLLPAITPNPTAIAPQRKMQPHPRPEPAPQAKPKGKLPPAAVHLTAVIPGRKRKPAPPPPPPSEMTDPHCAIFDIIDAERDGRSNRVGSSSSVVSARRGR